MTAPATVTLDLATLLQKARLASGMHVADFGCGRTGQLVFRAAETVGDRGIVYAVDILKDVLETIAKNAALRSLSQVRTVWSNIEKVGASAIPEALLDVVFFVDSFSSLTQRDNALAEAARLLKDKARLVIVDWTDTNFPLAPKDRRPVDFAGIISWAATQGFAVQEDEPIGAYRRQLILFRS